MKDKDAQLMMEALQKANIKGALSEAIPFKDPPFDIIPGTHYFVINDWLGRFIKYIGSQPGSKGDYGNVPDQHVFEVTWLTTNHEKPEQLWVYRDEETEGLMGYGLGGRLKAKLTKLDSEAQYRDLGYTRATTTDQSGEAPATDPNAPNPS
jgi:hypothetical protein